MVGIFHGYVSHNQMVYDTPPYTSMYVFSLSVVEKHRSSHRGAPQVEKLVYNPHLQWSPTMVI